MRVTRRKPISACPRAVTKRQDKVSLSVRCSSGFTFLEVLIALVILSIAGVGVLRLIQGGQETFGRTRRIMVAEEIAVRKLMEIETDGVSSITDRSGEDDPSAMHWKARSHSMQNPGHYRLEIGVYMAGEERPLLTIEKLFIEKM